MVVVQDVGLMFSLLEMEYKAPGLHLVFVNEAQFQQPDNSLFEGYEIL